MDIPKCVWEKEKSHSMILRRFRKVEIHDESGKSPISFVEEIFDDLRSSSFFTVLDLFKWMKRTKRKQH